MNTTPKETGRPRVLVCQRGARHRYAIPRLLEEKGLLAALYTDSTAYSPAGRWARGLSTVGIGRACSKALVSRRPGGVPPEKIFSTDRPLLSSLSKGRVANDLAGTYKRWGMREANVVYSMYGEDYAFLQWAKEQGAKIIVDVFVHPSTNRIVDEETRRQMGDSSVQGSEIGREDLHSMRAFQIADILLCPSEWVAEGVRGFLPECAGKVRVVPYGSSIALQDGINEDPTIGRILFAGREPLRKGLHYLAEAASSLREKNGMELDVRVAGATAGEVAWMEHGDQLNCLGTLPMDQMHDEFRQADVFVFPSLSEGQAGVLLEAMASGCPVIATRESGVDFIPGCGVSVPVGDAAALAEAMATVVGDRAARNHLAEGALKQAAEFSMDAWRERLVGVVNEAIEK